MIKRNHIIAIIIGLAFIAGFSNMANAQKKVKGKVVDSKGAAISNVSITVDGVTVASSAVDGSFQLTVAKGKTIDFTAVNFQKASVTYDGNPLNTITLLSAASTASASSNEDSLIFERPLPSLRQDGAVKMTFSDELRRALPYEELRSDDVVFRVRLWEEIDCRQKMNLPFIYKGNTDLGNQRFISILLAAITDPDSTKRVTVFDDERFAIPSTKEQIAQKIMGVKQKIDILDTNQLSPTFGQPTGKSIFKRNEVNWDSAVLKYKIMEEVVFDRESSRLFWRILGIAPVKFDIEANKELPTFWIYYPDLRSKLATFKVYNGKNLVGQKSWDDFFQERAFSGYIYKTSDQNFFDRNLSEIPGMRDKDGTNGMLLRLYESDNIKNKIFDMEQNAWSY